MVRLAAIALALTVLWGVATVAADPPAPRADLPGGLEPLARSLIDGEYCSAVVIAVVAGAAPPQIFAWGTTAAGNATPAGGTTVFEIGSVSKVFTSLVLAGMVIDHQVALDTPVAKLLPLNAKLPASKRPITVLDLATHTSGLPRMPSNFHPADPANPYADYTSEQLFAFLATATLGHEPGAGYEYSNLGAGLLGQALARTAKAEWGALVVGQIARPLGMTHTMVALTDDARAHFAQGYDRDGDPVPPWDLPALAGAGALRSTALDMATFVKAELAAAHEPKSRLARAMALTQVPQRDLTSEAPGKIGLAWHIKPDGLIWHNGQTGGFHSYVAFRPAQGIGVVVLVNGSAPQVDKLGAAAIAAAGGAAVPATLDLDPADRKLPEATLESYVGTYAVTPSFGIAISRSGTRLYGTGTGQPRFRLHATSPRDFAVRVVAASLTFEVDAKGKVTGLVLHQGGADVPAKRQ
jgi:CubicO group peptidase (beta-lactamase class C family)